MTHISIYNQLLEAGTCPECGTRDFPPSGVEQCRAYHEKQRLALVVDMGGKRWNPWMTKKVGFQTGREKKESIPRNRPRKKVRESKWDSLVANDGKRRTKGQAAEFKEGVSK